MKLSLALLSITLAAGSLACAQEAAGDRVVVPARNSTHPRKVDASLMHGSITVKSYAGKEVIVEARGSSGSSPDKGDRTVEGLKRLDFPARGLTVEEEDNVVTVRMNMNSGRSGDVVISVPADTSLKLQRGIGRNRNHQVPATAGVHVHADRDNVVLFLHG